jgi:hypothetical protein
MNPRIHYPKPAITEREVRDATDAAANKPRCPTPCAGAVWRCFNPGCWRVSTI